MGHIYSIVTSGDILPNIKYKQRSQSLSANATEAIIEKTKIFIANDLAFNRQININVEQAGITDAQAFIKYFMRRLRLWHEKNNIRFCYFWMLEIDATVGLHAHILIHTNLDAYGALDQAIKGWLPFERDDKPSAKNTIYHHSNVDDVWEVVGYRIKALHHRIPNCLIKPHWRSYQGYIKGKRWGMTRGSYT